MTKKNDYFKTICKMSRAFGTTLNKDEILKLERISIILYMEERVKTKLAVAFIRYFRKLLVKLPKLKYFSRIFSTNTAGYSFIRTEGHVYLDVVESMVQDNKTD